MRVGLRAKETLAITLLTFLVVAVTSLIYFSQLTRITVLEASRQAELIAQQIYAQSSRALARKGGGNPWGVLRRDPELRSLIDASVGYSPDAVYALLADQQGTVILHSQRKQEGKEAAAQPALQSLLSLNPLRRLVTLYEGNRVYEAVLPLNLNSRPFGSIRIGLSTTLVRRELNASLRQGLILAGVALVCAWAVALGLANLTIKPLRRITQQMERFRRGEFEVGSDFAPRDEFKALASELQLLGQKLQSDRLKSLGERVELHHVVDKLEDGLIFFNQDSRILFLNKAAEAIVGKALDEVRDRALAEVLPPLHPLRTTLERLLPLEGGARNATVSVAQDGRSREFLISTFAVTEGEHTMGAMVLLKDLDSIKTLQSLVSYSAKLTALGRLTSGVAHEVKNPLNAMMIHLELLKDRLGPASEGQENLEVIGSEIKRLDRALQGFLKFIRPQELTLKAVDLNALLQNVIALLEVEWQQAGVRFEFQPKPSLPPITADEELLHQAFMNLVLNACQAMSKGGTVRLAAESESREMVRLTVADEGAGIPPEDLDKIFALYYTTRPDGSGIGLSLVYRTVQLHDGNIDVSSEVGKGTTVTVRLPVR
jgi:PAS domain S-box-containing protein